MSTDKSRHYSVYVIELDAVVLLEKKFRAANGESQLDRSCLYVGMTGRSPEERFQQHKSGYKACRYVKKYGLYLRPRLYEKYNPMTFEEAQSKEVELANHLRGFGHAVWQK